ncbi:30S ribosomal protein S8 [Rhodovulum sp. DZ06]|uniref:30S ribosomal protein S8 n=1 Tax=Rhodovulum sp. DZ06 TaxID=3425126 RepID=UPI003D32B2A5
MSVNDPIGDMLARIRNAQMRRKSTVLCPVSKVQGWVLDVLLDEGFIRGYEKLQPEGQAFPMFEISLKYYDGEPVIRELKRVSTPGRRVYSGVTELPQVRQGLGVAIISTPKGVMSDASARAANVGGEVLCTVF